jgi:hypothetical protein
LKTSFTAVAVMAMLAVAGCGSSDKKKSSSGSSGSNGALSYSDFGKQASAICKTANDKANALSSKFTGSAANDAPLFDTIVPAIQDGVAQFKKLKPPAELKAPYDEFIAVSDQQVTADQAAQTAAKSGDDAAYHQALLALKPLDAKSKAAASQLGAAECAK